MTTDNDDDMREGGARIEDLPASDLEISAQDREKPSGVRAPPDDWEPDEPEDVRRSPPPTDPEGAQYPVLRDPDE